MLLNYLKTLNLKSWRSFLRCGSKMCSRYTWWPVWCCANFNDVQTYSLMMICWDRNMSEWFYVFLCILTLKSAF